ncbi:MAG: ATP-binding protein [Thermoplasmata archaeon]
MNSKRESIFVDREEILGRLNDTKNDVIDGNGKVVFLKGERGIGKTKVAETFIERCVREGFKVFQGRCLYYETSEPYIPFYDALEGHFDQQQVDEEKEQTSNLGLMVQRGLSSSQQGRSHLGLIGTGEEENKGSKKLSKDSKREMMFNQLTDFILDTSKESPVVLFLDDLQWIDESSSQLLHHLSRNITDNKVMILGAYRPEELKRKQNENPLQNILIRMKKRETFRYHRYTKDGSR